MEVTKYQTIAATQAINAQKVTKNARRKRIYTVDSAQEAARERQDRRKNPDFYVPTSVGGTFDKPIMPADASSLPPLSYVARLVIYTVVEKNRRCLAQEDFAAFCTWMKSIPDNNNISATLSTVQRRKSHTTYAPIPSKIVMRGAWNYNEVLLPTVHRRIAALCYKYDLSGEFITTLALQYGIHALEAQAGIDNGKLPTHLIAVDEPTPPPFRREGNDVVYYDVTRLLNLDRRLAIVCRKTADTRNIMTRMLDVGLCKVEQFK